MLIADVIIKQCGILYSKIDNDKLINNLSKKVYEMFQHIFGKSLINYDLIEVYKEGNRKTHTFVKWKPKINEVVDDGFESVLICVLTIMYRAP